MAATIIWGSAFIAQSVGMDHIGPMTFQAARCGLGAIFLVPVIYIFDTDKKSYLQKWMNPKLWRTGFLCGSALFVAAGLQQVGLVYTTAGKAGFITAWVSVCVAVAGLYLLSCVGATQINIGDILMLGGALGFAVQITLIDRLAADQDGLRLNCIQAFVCSLLSCLVMAVTETPTLSGIMESAMPIAYAGILSMGVAYSLQIVGQKHLEPTPASLIMSLESVFAALCGWMILKEQMSVPELCGCGLVFAAVIISQLPEKKKAHG